MLERGGFFIGTIQLFILPLFAHRTVGMLETAFSTPRFGVGNSVDAQVVQRRAVKTLQELDDGLRQHKVCSFRQVVRLELLGQDEFGQQ